VPVSADWGSPPKTVFRSATVSFCLFMGSSESWRLGSLLDEREPGAGRGGLGRRRSAGVGGLDAAKDGLQVGHGELLLVHGYSFLDVLCGLGGLHADKRPANTGRFLRRRGGSAGVGGLDAAEDGLQVFRGELFLVHVTPLGGVEVIVLECSGGGTSTSDWGMEVSKEP